LLHDLLAPIVQWMTSLMQASGNFGVAFLMALNSACIPLPSEVIMPFAGYLCSAAVPEGKRLTIIGISLSGAVGATIGSVAAYLAGMAGGRPFLMKYGKYLLIRRRDLDRADYWFAHYGDWAIFISRMLPIIHTFISFPAGIARMPFWRFLALTFVGSIPWCWGLGYVGLLLGDRWEEVGAWLKRFDLAIAAACVGLFALWLWHHLRPEHEPAEPAGAAAPSES
jgi:membrane protein DedA with SNARE-associated domain